MVSQPRRAVKDKQLNGSEDLRIDAYASLADAVDSAIEDTSKILLDLKAMRAQALDDAAAAESALQIGGRCGRVGQKLTDEAIARKIGYSSAEEMYAAPLRRRR